jgi:TPR repeat protein
VAPDQGGGAPYLDYSIRQICNQYEVCLQECDQGLGFSCTTASAMAPQWNEQALGLALRGCELGDPRGCTIAALALNEGDGVAKDVPRAMELAQTACDAAIPDITAHKIDQTVALACMLHGQLAFDLGDGKDALGSFDRACPTDFQACRGGATVLLRGIGVAPDPAGARAFMQRSCEAGDSEACVLMRQPEFK